MGRIAPKRQTFGEDTGVSWVSASSWWCSHAACFQSQLNVPFYGYFRDFFRVLSRTFNFGKSCAIHSRTTSANETFSVVAIRWTSSAIFSALQDAQTCLGPCVLANKNVIQGMDLVYSQTKSGRPNVNYWKTEWLYIATIIDLPNFCFCGILLYKMGGPVQGTCAVFFFFHRSSG